MHVAHGIRAVVTALPAPDDDDTNDYIMFDDFRCYYHQIGDMFAK